MRTSSKLATLGVAGVLALAPGAALAAGQGNGNKPPKPGHSHSTTTTTTPPTKAFGKFCQGQSKTHDPHSTLKGTDFSRCVRDMAKLAHHKTNDPHVACKDEPKTHVKGEKGTAFSRCVVAGNRLLQSMRKSSKKS